jgi:hypothetical protein
MSPLKNVDSARLFLDVRNYVNHGSLGASTNAHTLECLAELERRMQTLALGTGPHLPVPQGQPPRPHSMSERLARVEQDLAAFKEAHEKHVHPFDYAGGREAVRTGVPLVYVEPDPVRQAFAKYCAEQFPIMSPGSERARGVYPVFLAGYQART